MKRLIKKLTDRWDYFLAKYFNRWGLHGVKVMMFCPACGQRLCLESYARKYETLSEHVSDPNRDFPAKPSFICLNENCPLCTTTGAFFGEEGSLFSGGGPIKPEKYWTAIGSLSRLVNKQTDKVMKRSRKQEEMP